MENPEILIVDDEEAILDIEEMYLSSLGYDSTLRASSGNEAIEVLKKNQQIKVVFSDYRMEDGNGVDLLAWIIENRPEVSFHLVSTYSLEDIRKKTQIDLRKSDSSIAKPFREEDFCQVLTKVFGDSSSEDVEKPLFHQVTYEILQKYISQEINVFIKIGSDKFVKIFHGSGELEETIQHYLKKGVTHFYVNRNDFESLYEEVLDKALSETQMGPLSANVNAYLHVHEATSQLLKNSGMKEIYIKQAEEVVSSMIEKFKEQKSQNELFQKIVKQKDYFSKHSFLSAYVASIFSSKLSWINNEEMAKKLVFASLFKDISLVDQRDLASLFVLPVDAEKRLGRDYETVKNHPFESVNILSDMRDFSDDMNRMIINHHELPEGDGFPRKIDSNLLAPMEAIFHFICRFSHEFIEFGSGMKSFDLLLKEISSDYQSKTYAEGLGVVKEIFRT